jgi:hypothetical protein
MKIMKKTICFLVSGYESSFENESSAYTDISKRIQVLAFLKSDIPFIIEELKGSVRRKDLRVVSLDDVDMYRMFNTKLFN